MIVDDSAFMRMAVERILQTAGDIEICASLPSGELALEQVETVKPDLITMDVEMPGIGGLEAVRAIMVRRRTPIIMLSSLTTQGTATTVEALASGAVDCIAKPSGTTIEVQRISAELIEKIRALARRSGGPAPAPVRHILTPVTMPGRDGAHSERSASPALARKHQTECIAIGISTGGPAALAALCAKLDATIRVPIIVVQHMPAGFTKPLADRLNSLCPLAVVEGEDQMPMQAGRIVIGVAGKQLRVRRVSGRVVVGIDDNQNESLYTPSADVLFRSMAEVYGKQAVAFIMTGMGNDGTEGLRELKKAGAYVYGQDEATSVVYGMPRSAAVAGLVDTQLPLGAVAQAINAAAKGFVM